MISELATKILGLGSFVKSHGKAICGGAVAIATAVFLKHKENKKMKLEKAKRDEAVELAKMIGYRTRQIEEFEKEKAAYKKQWFMFWKKDDAKYESINNKLVALYSANEADQKLLKEIIASRNRTFIQCMGEGNFNKRKNRLLEIEDKTDA